MAAAAEHQATQGALADLLAREVAAAWRLLNVSQLQRTLPQLSAAVAALVEQYGNAAAAIAADFYDQQRAAAGAAGTFTVIPAAPPGPDQVAAGVSWATKDLWTGQPDTAAARTLVTGVAERLAIGTGRQTVLDAVMHDRAAKGWARVPEPGACAFCAMLATRGAVYKTQGTAGFQAHDHDRCHVEPVFGIYEPTARVREWQALWRKATAGKSGDAARAAFRDALGHN